MADLRIGAQLHGVHRGTYPSLSTLLLLFAQLVSGTVSMSELGSLPFLDLSEGRFHSIMSASATPPPGNLLEMQIYRPYAILRSQQPYRWDPSVCATSPPRVVDSAARVETCKALC